MLIYEPQRQKTYRQICAPRDNSDKLENASSLVRFFTGRILDSKETKIYSCGQMKTDQTARMRRLI